MTSINNINKTEEDKKQYLQTLQEFHSTYAQDFQKIEQNFIELIVAIIAALSIYGYGLKEFLYKIGECSEQAFILYTIATFGTNILLLIAFFVSNIKAYQARQLQIIVFRIEDKLQVVPDIIPKKWNPCEEERICSPPEIYQFFKFVSLFLLAPVDVFYFYLSCKYIIKFGILISYLFLMGIGIFFVFLFVSLAMLKFRWKVFFKLIVFLCLIFIIWIEFLTCCYLHKELNLFFGCVFLMVITIIVGIIISLYCIDKGLICGLEKISWLRKYDLISTKSYSEKLKELCKYWYNKDC